MRRLLLLTAVCICSWAKGPITHELMWKMKRVGAPALSADGKWAVVAVTEPAYDPKDTVSDLWMVAMDGTSARRLTHTKGSEGGVDWRADGKAIVFTARREGDESAQVYLLDIAGGGEARRITGAVGGASSPKFSPDGKWVLYQAWHDPIEAERKLRKYNARVYTGFPIRLWDHWLDERKPTLHVQEVDGSRKRDLLVGTKLLAGAGYNGVSTNSGPELQAVWSPDGQQVIFTATENRHETAYASGVTSLFQVAVSGGEPVRITDGKDSYTEAKFRPDGKALYSLREVNNSKVYNLSRVAKFDWPGAAAMKVVTAEFDRSVAGLAFSADSRTLYVTADEHGLVKVFRVPADGGVADLAVNTKFGEYTGLAAAGDSVAAVFDSSTHPAELVRIDGLSGHRRLTSFNKDTAEQIDWQAPRHFWFTSKKGRRIHNMIFLPPSFDPGKKYPLVVVIHGGAHLMATDQFHQRWNYHLLASPGYVVLTTNYTGSTGFGEAFAQAIQNDPLKTPGEEINEAVDEALKQFPFIDGARMAAGGASYGGHLANWLEATTTRFRCLYSHAGLVNLESQWGTSDTIYHRELNNGGPVWEQGPVWREQSPARHAAKFQTPMLLTVGESDYRVPLNQTIENWSLLQRRKVPSRLVVFPDENHWILKGENNRYFYQELLGWLGKYLQ